MRPCAYAHFLTYGLMLRERREYRIEAPDLGILFHSALELFSKKLAKSGRLWHELEDSERDAPCPAQCGLKTAAQHSHYDSSGQLQKSIFAAETDAYGQAYCMGPCRSSCRRGKFEPAEYELRFDADSRLGYGGYSSSPMMRC